MSAVISARNLSKYYGNVLGLSEISLDIGPGITGDRKSTRLNSSHT